MFGPGKKSLQERSAGILNVFQKTVEDLRFLNDDIHAEQVAAEETIKQLEAKQAELSKLFTKNDGVITKIENLIK